MKTYKLSLIAALALGGLMACATLATAQDNKDSNSGQQGQGRRGMSVDARMERLTTELTLTDAQKPKVKAVLEDTQKKMRELRDDSSLSQEQRREKMGTIREDESKALKPILTPEQMEKYKNLPQQFRRGQGGQGGQNKEGEKKAN
jgi:Spy/CpxP family protein refolding chaperone